MFHSIENRIAFRFLLFSILIGLIIRVSIIISPLEQIIVRYGSDDLFYFTEIAKNFAAGNGLSFDGLNPTTGVQPLFGLLLSPFADYYAGYPELALKVVLSMASTLTIIMCFLLPVYLRKIIPQYGWVIGCMLGSFWVLSPKILQVTFEGTEASLAAISWITSYFFWFRSNRKNNYYLFGGIIGLGILVRIDHLILAAVLCLLPVRSLKDYIFKFFQMLPGVIIPSGIWWAYSYYTIGSIFQDSGNVKIMNSQRIFAKLHNIPFDELTSLSGLWMRFQYSLEQAFKSISIISHAESRPSIALLLLIIIVIFKAISISKYYKTRQSFKYLFPITSAFMRSLWPLLLAGSLLFSVYAVLLIYMRSWYLMPLFLFTSIIIAAIIADLCLKINRFYPWLVIFCLSFFMHIEANLFPRRGMPDEQFSVLRDIEQFTPQGSVIGSFNAGVYGAFHSQDRTVVNLDGVVNHGAYVAQKNFSLAQYMNQQKIEFLCDYYQSIDHFDEISGGGIVQNIELIKMYPIQDDRNLTIGLWRYNYHK